MIRVRPDRSDLPNTFMLGVAKAGTTSLVNYLSQHPEVFLPDIKEPNHFVSAPAPPGYEGPLQADLFDPLMQRSSFPGELEYKNLYRGASGIPVRFDASVRYIFHPVAVAAIAHELPDARHIVVLRDSVERLVSHWRMNRQYQIEPLGLGEALASEDERFARGIGWDWLYRRLGTYAPQLRHLFSHIARENVKVVLYGDFVADPESVLADCFQFLNVDDTFHPDRSTRGMVPSEPRWRWLDLQLNWPGPFRRAVRRLPGSTGEALLGRLRDLNAGPPAELDDTDLDALRLSFSEDVADTARLLDMKVGDLAPRLRGTLRRTDGS